MLLFCLPKLAACMNKSPATATAELGAEMPLVKLEYLTIKQCKLASKVQYNLHFVYRKTSPSIFN